MSGIKTLCKTNLYANNTTLRYSLLLDSTTLITYSDKKKFINNNKTLGLTVVTVNL